MPTSATQRSTPAGPSSIGTPSASSTSADPHCDDAAAVAVLHDTRARAGRDERGHRRDVDGARAIAAGAAGVDRAVGDGDRASRTGSIVRTIAASSVDRLALGAQRDGEARGLDVGRAAREDLAERGLDLVGVDVDAPHELGEHRRDDLVHAAQSHHRSWSSTPLAMSPS